MQTIWQLNIKTVNFISSIRQVSVYTGVNRWQQRVETCADAGGTSTRGEPGCAVEAVRFN